MQKKFRKDILYETLETELSYLLDKNKFSCLQ